MVVGEEETEGGGREGLELLDEAGECLSWVGNMIYLLFGEIETYITYWMSADEYTGIDHSNWSFLHCSTSFPDLQLSRCLGRRFPILDEHIDDTVSWSNIHDPMVGTQ